jgi:hypothetical protein
VKKCGVCGGAMREGRDYKAPSDDGQRLVDAPSVDCVRCGAMHPDSVRVRAMPANEVPSSMRIRCALPAQVPSVPAVHLH